MRRFVGAAPIEHVVTPTVAGTLQTINLDGLAPGTPYVIGIRAYDDCGHDSPLVIVRFETPTSEVSACACTSSDPRGFGVIALGVVLALRRRRFRSNT
jgi:MYXO-CTERM domain-containing protein